MAKAEISATSGKPLLAGLQLAPLSVLLNTLPAAAYSVAGVAGSIARAEALECIVVLIQVSPPFVLLNTPSLVATYRLAGANGFITSSEICVLCGPPFRPTERAFQVPPPSVLLKTQASI